MRRALLALAVAASLLVAGCATDQPGSTATDGSPTPSPSPMPTPELTGSAESPTATATQTPGSVGSTATPTETASTPTAEPTSGEYRVRRGSIPEEFDSLDVTFRVVFVDERGDLGA